MNSFDRFFERVTKLPAPWGWQRELAELDECGDRLVRIPTGFGKTLGVLSAWLWHRVERGDDRWPRRLVWCLPMRVLVEQTAREARKCIEHLGLLWNEDLSHDGVVGVHLLMGGSNAGRWQLYPESCSVLVGTQDMLLSRAMNRGYGSPRARWPMEFGLLNQDTLWVMDEVQLMDVGLATSTQLQTFRREDAARSFRPCHTWWMSATLQRDWLDKSPDSKQLAAEVPQVRIPPSERTGHLWADVAKVLSRAEVKSVKDLAALVAEEHRKGERGAQGPTLVVLNTVDRATELFTTLKKDKDLKGTELQLVHSRFRPAERAAWANEFLDRSACGPATNRIIVATQVVEAGVDISASRLITEVAPWAGLVQRFGRCARWGGEAWVTVVDFSPKDDKAAAPYTKAELDASLDALSNLDDVSALRLERFEEENPSLLPVLYPYEPTHLLLRHELDELFDTTPDLSGADIDISRFIRSGEERDLHVFWAEVDKDAAPSSEAHPSRESLCAVPFLRARDWLCGKETSSSRKPHLKQGMRAWVWDWLDGAWRRAERRDLYPGQTVLVDSCCGGYDPRIGWALDSEAPVPPVLIPSAAASDLADGDQNDESLSASQWQTIAVHGRETGRCAREIASALVPQAAGLLHLAGRWHDVGKAHAAFNGSIVGSDRPDRQDLAKAPKQAWRPRRTLYTMPDGSRRPGFRHELASTLALFDVLVRHTPDHPALLGPWRDFLREAGFEPTKSPAAEQPPSSIEREILGLEPEQFDLLAYLVCAHHGKLRLAWHANPGDQETRDGTLRIRGVRKGDMLPSLPLFDQAQSLSTLPPTYLDLAPAASGLSPRTGRSWTDRVLELQRRLGSFGLAWLEALLRAADQRASSRTDIVDDLLAKEVTP